MKYNIKKRQIWYMILIIGILSGLTLLGNNPYGQPICVWKNIFGIACPGCGLSRGVSAIMRGHFQQALQYNYLSYPLFVMLLIAFFCILYDLVTGKNFFYDWIHKIHWHWSMFFIVLVIVLINWMLNIYRGL